MSLDEHVEGQFYWSAESDHCPHGPEPDGDTEAWDEWSDRHPMSDEGRVCLDAPAGTACVECSTGLIDMVPWGECRERIHVRPRNGMVPNPDAEHQEVPVWTGPLDCLDRECDEYFTEAGDDDPAVKVCSHIREEVSCSCRRLGDGEYGLEPCSIRSS
ncbi:hypothetical protein [Streptomyces sp. 5-10]|uniref:hypothetical protein n=1 Tax=Streptomyces sp. 5-10 TaxID=878925 RepID=UPI00168B7D07|nr:hypothetical protein [Streptomyces sp. 5-10]MBD3004769.1 hypothetical protein [Streptomyces sp. 5-10]